MTQDEAFWHIKRVLGEIDGLLLVVDNVDKKMADDPSLEFLQKIPCAVLVSTRFSQALTNFHPIETGFMDMDRCKEVFKRYAGLTGAYDGAVLEKIITRTGRHTLVIEIIAKALKRRRMGLDEMLGEMEAKGLNIRIPVATAHSGDIEKEMMEQLNKLYALSDIDNNPLFTYILKNFAVLHTSLYPRPTPSAF